MIMSETIGQIVGFIAMGIIVFSYQQRTHKNILVYQMISGLLFTVHYNRLVMVSQLYINKSYIQVFYRDI